MKRPTIFVNELSRAADCQLDVQELRTQVLSALKTANEMRRVKRELIVVGALTELAFGRDGHTLQSILHGSDYRDEWRSIKKLEQSSPYGEDDWVMAGDLEEIRIEGQAGVGLLRAVTNGSAVLSFPSTATWMPSRLGVQRYELHESADEVWLEIEILNFADTVHVTEHLEFLISLGADLSASSIIHENDDFTLRMYFNDHDPPHFHVMEQHRPSETIARFRIDTLDQLTQSSSLRPGLRRQIVNWAENRRDDLMSCWHDCRQHRHPARIA
jgi:hypothetical protein